jgi:hypothetical protein
MPSGPGIPGPLGACPRRRSLRRPLLTAILNFIVKDHHRTAVDPG